VKNDKVMYCDKCKAPVKPDIVFFGEGLPRSFFDALEDLHDVDLLIVAGTALAVSPFNVVPSELGWDVPKVLFNMENVFETCGIDFDELLVTPFRGWHISNLHFLHLLVEQSELIKSFVKFLLFTLTVDFMFV